jgi:Chalcone isomerase-like
MRYLNVKQQVISVCLFICSSIIPQVFAQSSTNTVQITPGSVKVKTENFPKQIQVEGTKLALNGLGTRYKAIFKVYDMGLYTTAKSTTLQEAINAAGPKKLQFVAHREISTSELGRLFYQGIKDNNSTEMNLKHMVSATRLSDIASVRSKILPGESFSIEYIPGKGMIFSVMDKPQGPAIGDAEFFSMVLKIWLGNTPADFMLKDALLGIQKSDRL